VRAKLWTYGCCHQEIFDLAEESSRLCNVKAWRCMPLPLDDMRHRAAQPGSERSQQRKLANRLRQSEERRIALVRRTRALQRQLQELRGATFGEAGPAEAMEVDQIAKLEQDGDRITPVRLVERGSPADDDIIARSPYAESGDFTTMPPSSPAGDAMEAPIVSVASSPEGRMHEADRSRSRSIRSRSVQSERSHVDREGSCEDASDNECQSGSAACSGVAPESPATAISVTSSVENVPVSWQRSRTVVQDGAAGDQQLQQAVPAAMRLGPAKHSSGQPGHRRAGPQLRRSARIAERTGAAPVAPQDRPPPARPKVRARPPQQEPTWHLGSNPFASFIDASRSRRDTSEAASSPIRQAAASSPIRQAESPSLVPQPVPRARPLAGSTRASASTSTGISHSYPLTRGRAAHNPSPLLPGTVRPAGLRSSAPKQKSRAAVLASVEEPRSEAGARKRRRATMP